ncbi:MAG: LamG domain-containing protein [Lentisphaeria bacterium]|nr:LamG domain-containing protein [Lentisphaeria bacterium]
MKKYFFLLLAAILSTVLEAGMFPTGKLILKGRAKVKGDVLYLDGKSAFAYLPGTEDYNIGPSGLTLACCVKLNDNTTRTGGSDPTGYDMFFSKGDVPFVFGRYLSRIYTNIKNAANKNQFGCATRSYTIPNAGEWTHVAAVFRPYNHHEQGDVGYFVTVYFNGDRIAHVKHKGLIPLTNKSMLDVGKGWGDVWMLNGAMADIFAEKKALTDAQIADLADNSRALKYLRKASNPGLAGIKPRSSAGKWLLSVLNNMSDFKRGTETGKKLSSVWQAENDKQFAARFPKEISGLKLYCSKEMYFLLDTRALRGNPLLGMYDRIAGRAVLANSLPAWKASGKCAGKRVTLQSETLPCRVSDISAKGFTVTWNAPAPAALSAVSKVSTDNNGITADLKIINKTGNLILQHVNFPIVHIPQFGGNDVMFYPSMSGAEVKNPLVNVFARGQSGIYPTASLSMQYSAYYGNGRGVFLGWQDPAGTVKSYQALAKRKQLEFSWSQDVALPLDKLQGGNSYASPGAVRYELFSGNWYEAAMIHKKWALAKADWRVPLPRTETPEWFRKIPLVFAMRGYSDRSANINYAWFKYLREYLGTPAYITWMHWFFLNSYTWPEYPARPYTVKIFKDMIRKGNYTEPYLDGRLWCTIDHKEEKGNKKYLARGKQLAVKLENGTIPTEDYGGVLYAVMCPMTRGWQDKLFDMAKQIAPFASGFYMDQVTAGQGIGCFDKTHGHALNDTSVWISKGFRPAMKRIKAAFPGVPLTSEDAAEAYLDIFDGGHVWRWSYPGIVPAFQAIYGGRMQYFGLLYDKTLNGRGSMESNFIKTARSLCHGLKISRTGVEELEPANENRLFFKKMIHLRMALTDYFDRGEMLAPIRFKQPLRERTVRASIPGGTELLTVPVITSNTYKLGKNRVYIFINNTPEKVTFAPILPKGYLCMEGKEKTAPFTGSITLDSRRTALVVCGEASEAERLQKTLKKISTFTPGISRTEFNKKHLKEYLNK